MAGLGRKILSAFLEVTPTPPKATENPESNQETKSSPQKTESYAQSSPPVRAVSGNQGPAPASPADTRFSEYFDKLFSEANIPGPDYYEFSKMIEAMQAIANEQSRYYAAYAGLYAQGVDKDKLLSTAGEYLRILETDAHQFHTTVDTAMQEKVQSRKAEEREKSERIQSLSQEISDLQNRIGALQKEIKENEEKIEASTGGYTAENARRAARIQADIEKIKHYLH
jgi:predicted ribosome quality control (RQC) complex YloA/Tae2 family protein